MGCPYISNEKHAIVCPKCGGTNISSEVTEACPFGCWCKDCGHVLCKAAVC